jgi:histidine triad (HIT) family protein
MASLFTRIINGELPSIKEYEDEFCIVIHNKYPQAKIHLLIIPKKEIPTIMDVENEDQALLGHLILIARDMGKKLGLEGYKLQFNVGHKGGQEIFHIHLHLMAD